jgi:extracellular factor (EF) 3-hydroxypalmitic acid methyl ester biosynthesis protein
VGRICSGANTAPPGTLGYWLEEYHLVCGMAQQHRNKVQRQARELLSVVRAAAQRSTPCRFLVLACGASPDLELVQDELASLPFYGVAIDQDPEAIEASQCRLTKISDRMHFIKGNVVRKIPELSRGGPFDLVVAGGLFDYLPERLAGFLVNQICTRLLAQGGRFFFTNIARGNPYEDWTRYVCEWRLIQRSETEIQVLLGAAGEGKRVCFERDLTRLTVLVTVDMPPAEKRWNCESM